jgi:tRNA-specific 2-thiouridylase
MINTYKKGLTPNPDVLCNSQIKFGLFLEKALEIGADFVATGHYVRKIEDKKRGIFRLIQAKDLNKDQSYFLWKLNQKQISRALFPIGDYLKSEVREIAKKAGLPVFNKKDSQGICFLGKVPVFDFLKKYIKEKEGDVLDPDGKKIGTHRGVWFYTIGQRHIGVPAGNLFKGKKEHEPLYVFKKDVKRNILFVAPGENNPLLYKSKVKIKDFNFLSKELIKNYIKNKKIEMPVFVRVRYRQPLFPAKILGKLNSKKLDLIFNEPQKFVAEGQSAVFYLPYKNNFFELIGGGVIE